MSSKRLCLSIFMVLCLLFLPFVANASKKDEGSVKGTVHKNSASGKALSGVKVKCGGEDDKTDDDGKFKIKGIKKGEHTIKFSKDGYESYQTTVKIKAGETANVGDRWLIKESSSGSNSESNSCPSGNGLYCGEASKGQNAGDLYKCKDGNYSHEKSCGNGCQKNAAGKDDSCKTVTPAKCPSGNGLYCGDTGKGQNAGNLYQCTNGSYSLKTTCSNGCQKNAEGKDDGCKSATSVAPTPTPAKCPTGNGLYCGDTGKGQNASNLYQCTNGNYSLKTACSNGCQQNAAGKDDSCRTLPGGNPPIGENPRISNEYPYRKDKITNCTATCYADEWGFCKKNCTSYIAWKINKLRGNNSFTNSMNSGKWGNAYNWDNNASRLGMTVNNTPSVGAIAQWNEKEVAGGYGHVAYVEKVNSDGTVNVSEYNFSNKCGYGERSNRRAPRYIHINPSTNSSVSVSQSIGSVSGKVYKNSVTSKEVLSDVKVECGGKSDKTNSNGEFKIKDVPAGNQTIKFSKDGYQTYSREVEIKAGHTAKMEDRWLVANDTIKPALLSFDVARNSSRDAVTISYKVKDSGGSGLKQVELWRGKTKDKLEHVQTHSASGDSKEGQFTDKTSEGTYYYGIHVLDNANNLAYDMGAKTLIGLIVAIDGMNMWATFLKRDSTTDYLIKEITPYRGKGVDALIEQDKWETVSFFWNNNIGDTHYYADEFYDYLKSKNSTNRPLVILSHSWGTVLSYIVLAKHKDIHVDKLITLGSPLGAIRTLSPVGATVAMTVSMTTVEKLLEFGLGPIYKPANVRVWHNYYTDCDDIGGKILSIQDNYENTSKYDGLRKCHSSYFEDRDKWKKILKDVNQ